MLVVSSEAESAGRGQAVLQQQLVTASNSKKVVGETLPGGCWFRTDGRRSA